MLQTPLLLRLSDISETALSVFSSQITGRSSPLCVSYVPFDLQGFAKSPPLTGMSIYHGYASGVMNSTQWH